MPTDLKLAQTCWDLYFDTTKIDTVLDIDGVCVGINHLPDASIICFRGSTTPEDWFRDFQAQMIYDTELSGVECGFIQGIRDIIGKRPAEAIPQKPVYITGHSLGAARALIFAALETLKGLPVAGVTVFGPPRPGAQQIKDILASVSVRCYKNRHDPVCDVPFNIPLFDPYTHVSDLIPVSVAPPPDDPWGLLADHHMGLYLDAMKAAQV